MPIFHRQRPKHLFVWLWPLLFAVISLFSFASPGDEYAMWAVSSFPGIWLYFLLSPPDLSNWLFPIIPALTGAALFAALGWIADRLKAAPLPWLVMWAIITPILIVLALMQYPSIDRAIAKNGPLFTYIFAAANLGFSASAILTIAVCAFSRRRSATPDSTEISSQS